MVKIISIFIIMLAQLNAAQKMGLIEHHANNKNELFGALANLRAPVVPNGKCSIPILCANPTNCKRVIDGINAAATPAAVAAALNSSCLAVCRDPADCSNKQLNAGQSWLKNYQQRLSQAEINRQKTKKTTYKTQVNFLRAQLDRANRNLDLIDLRLSVYLANNNIALPAMPGDQVRGIHLKLNQIFDNSKHLRDQLLNLQNETVTKSIQITQLRLHIQYLRDQIQDLTQSGREKDQQIAILQGQVDEKDQQIERLNTDIAARENEIRQLNEEIDKLAQDFDEAMQAVGDIQQSIRALDAELDNQLNNLEDLKGRYRQESARVLALVDALNLQIRGKGAELTQNYNEELSRLRERLAEIKANRQEISGEYQRLSEAFTALDDTLNSLYQ